MCFKAPPRPGLEGVLNVGACPFSLSWDAVDLALLLPWIICVADACVLGGPAGSLLPPTREPGCIEVTGVAITLVSFAGVIALTILLRKDCPTEGGCSSAWTEKTERINTNILMYANVNIILGGGGGGGATGVLTSAAMDVNIWRGNESIINVTGSMKSLHIKHLVLFKDQH